jgi:hypothetical protein
MTVPVKYNPRVGLRKAAWVAIYSAAPVLIQSLIDNLNAVQDLKRYVWFPPLIAALTMIGNWVRVRRQIKAGNGRQ